ncbi:MAG: hypothetical protein IJ507_01550 [Clostridia bacterium]|nr:hypothetical protein [Clostridia bacterium]
MKCCILALGGAGEQTARAFAYCALAGVVGAGKVDILLVDTDAPDTALQDWCADYDLLRGLWPRGGEPACFRTELRCRLWPGELPEEAASLQAVAASAEDELLLSTLFDDAAAADDLRRGFHGRSDVAVALLTGLAGSEMNQPGGDFGNLLRELEEACDAGEEVRVVLTGSAMGGVGAAGLTVLSRCIKERLPQAQLASVVLLPYFRAEEEHPAQAKAMLKQWAEDGLTDTIYLLGLGQGAYLTAAEGHQQARMPEWLAAYCAADFLRTGRRGVYGWRTAFDRFDWEAFGSDARAFRRGFERLMTAALALKAEFGGVIRQGVSEPRWLRDKLIGWYARHFMGVRKMEEDRRGQIAGQLEALMRLTEGFRGWMGEVIASLPPQMRTGSDMDAAMRESEENYSEIVRTHAQLVMVQRSAERSGLVDTMVHRSGLVDPELEQLSRAIDGLKARLKTLEENQEKCLHRTGGQAHMALLRQTAARCREEADRFRLQTEEAARLIRQAEEAAADAGRIANARTKLIRMEQSLEQLEERCLRAEADVIKGKKDGLRMIPPQVSEDMQAECGLFSAALLAAEDKKSLEAAWPEINEMRAGIAAAPVQEEQPMAGFLNALLGEEGD